MYHRSELRALTNRDRARIPTLPYYYIFLSRKEEVRQQVGMANNLEGARIIIEAILKTFAGIEYDSIEAKWNADEHEFDSEPKLDLLTV